MRGTGVSGDGRAYSEQEVKATLDRCRLTYLYEPAWPRLRERVSRLLSGGTLVAWFQGAADCSTTLAAGRAVLCDPSNRWAKENVNRFFRQVDVDAEVPLVALAGEEPWRALHLTGCRLLNAPAAAEWRNHVVGAIDREGCIHLYGIADAEALHLCELLRHHQARTRVPALIAVPFSASNEPVVSTPRDAIKAMFSSPIDVMVIERFIVAKDHWLLGTQGNERAETPQRAST